jgi:hypothetical protein
MVFRFRSREDWRQRAAPNARFFDEYVRTSGHSDLTGMRIAIAERALFGGESRRLLMQ